MEIASEEKVPPYIIFGDNTLKELSTRMPSNEEEFLDISGVGKAKLDKYGNAFIDTIKKYKNEKGIKVKFIFNNETNEDKKIKEVKHTKEKSYVTTVNMLLDGKGFGDIIKERGITLQTLFAHIQQYVEEFGLLNLRLDFKELFNEEEETIIMGAIEKVGSSALKPIKEIVPDNISYEMIKAVILKNIVLAEK